MKPQAEIKDLSIQKEAQSSGSGRQAPTNLSVQREVQAYLNIALLVLGLYALQIKNFPMAEAQGNSLQKATSS